MIEYGLQRGVLQKFDTNNPAQRSRFFSMPKFVRDLLKRFNVPFYDKCCSDASDGVPAPVGYNSGLQYWNGTAWVAASESAFGDGTVSDLAIKFGADGNNGFYGVSDTELGVAVEGAKVAGFSNTGLSLTGSLTTSGAVIFSGTETLTGAGAVSLSTYATLLVTTGANALTLAAGAEGQKKFIKMKTDGGDGTLTPNALQGGTTITFNDAGDFVELLYLDAKWNVLTNSGATIA